MQNAAASGSASSFIKSSLARLTFNSLPTFKPQVSAFEKYIIHINPRSPNTGNKIKISIILITESEIAVRNENAC